MTRDQWTLSLRLVLIPALLLLMALWQGHRADAARTEGLQQQSELQGFVLNMQQLQAQRSRESIQLGDKSYSPALAEALAQRRLHQLEREIRIARVGSWLPGPAQGFAALLLGLGAAALLALHFAGKAAMRSRDRLVSLFYIGRQVLPTALLSLVLLLTITVVLEIAYEALWLFTVEQTGSGLAKLQGVVGMILVIMLWPLYRLPRQLKAMTKLFDSEPHAIFGRALSEDQAPALWARVRALATRLDALMPDHIVVGYLDGFYVTSSDVELAPAGQRLQGRTLYVPIPLLALLDANETDAVIGHELAHFSGQDTDYSIHFMPIYDGAWRSVGVLRERMAGGFLQGLLTLPAHDLAVHFMRCFDHAVSHWSRSRELLADATAARLHGAQAVVDSLVRTTALGTAIDVCLNEWCQQPEAWPDDVLQALLAHLAAQPPQVPDGELDEVLPHPTDSHPPTIQRLQALGMGLEAVDHGRGLRAVVPSVAMADLEQALPGGAVLARYLGEELSTRLVEHHEQMRQELEARAQAADGRCVLHEGAQARGRLVLALTVLFAAGGLWLAWMALTPGTKPGLANFFGIVAGTLGALSVLFGVLGWRLIKRADTPALIFDAHSMHFANAPQAVALHHVEDYQILATPALTLRFQLAEQAPLPTFRRKGFWGPDAKFDAKTRTISLGLTRWSIDGEALDVQALVALVARYLEGGHARHTLAELQDQAPSTQPTGH
ncbi:M48 family metallopeptidase [Pseudomonas cremoricolorata]|uniref:Peptidase M48 domain-containing protein n=1 Tax=Pseudomonas cremoricolorata TaxID=157783 RepID=A0A089WI07_9PSED|nr:M48 family metallopeptidase [Pseudomonas cremoricolorata]AIR88945.1 hypothetical protein LK03_06525 [Pseudomonas cremoricolorata]